MVIRQDYYDRDRYKGGAMSETKDREETVEARVAWAKRMIHALQEKASCEVPELLLNARFRHLAEEALCFAENERLNVVVKRLSSTQAFIELEGARIVVDEETPVDVRRAARHLAKHAKELILTNGEDLFSLILTYSLEDLE